nr:hypothetical protein [Tanacetum cinerariifolium]
TLDPQRQLRVAVVHRVNRLAIAAVGLRQDDLQTSRADVLVGHEVRQADDALACQRQLTQGFAAGRGHGRVNEQAITIRMAQRPMVERFRLREPQQGMPAQRLNGLGRPVFFQVIGAGEDVQRAGTQRARVQGRVRQRTDAYRHVRALFKQVDDQVVAVQLQLNVRVQRPELSHVRDDGMQ